MDHEGKYHECDLCDVKDIGWHRCTCGVEHRPPTDEEIAEHEKAMDEADKLNASVTAL